MLWKQSLICKTYAGGEDESDSGYMHTLCEAISKEFLSLAMNGKVHGNAREETLPSPKTIRIDLGNVFCSMLF